MKTVIVIATLVLAGCRPKNEDASAKLTAHGMPPNVRLESQAAKFADSTSTDAEVTGVGASGAAASATISPCLAEAFDAVLDKLWPVLHISFSSTPDEQTIQGQERKISCIRDWAATLQDPCIKANYYRWLKHYQGQADGWRRDLASKGTVESDSAKYERELQDKALRIAAYERSHPVPKPPSCDLDLIRKVKP